MKHTLERVSGRSSAPAGAPRGGTAGAPIDERSLLIHVAAFGLRSKPGAISDDVLDARTWRRLLLSVSHERLGGHLVAAVAAGALPATPGQVSEAIEVHTNALTTCLVLDRILLGTVDSLARAGVEYRVLKGAAVAHTLYAEPSLRVYGDVDILVQSASYASAVATLLDAGFVRAWPELRPAFERRFGKGAVLTTAQGAEIDLHRTLVPGYFGLAIDLHQLFEGPSWFDVGGRHLACLAPEQRFLHACYHTALTPKPGLASLRDVAQMLLLSDLDEARVVDMAYQWSGPAVVARAIRLAWDTFSLPDVQGLAVWARHYRTSRKDRRILATYAGRRPAEAGRAVMSLRKIAGARQKAAFLRAMLLPDPRYLEWAGESYVSWLSRSSRALPHRTGEFL